MSAITSVSYHTVAEQYQQQRLDNYLLRVLKGVPKTHVYQIIRRGEVRVNSKRAKPSYRLQLGDVIRVPPYRNNGQSGQPLRPSQSLTELLQANILYEDQRLLVLNKPAGVAVHGGSGVSLGVIEALRVMRTKNEELELVHRLDRETSGCLLIAKKRAMLRYLHQLLRDSLMQKEYIALVAGHWAEPTVIQLPLKKNVLRSGERMVRVDAAGSEALSEFTPLKHYKDATLTRIRIATGRTHQIRVHAAGAGHAVLGDEKYGDKSANKNFQSLGLRRMFLHAARLSFMLPDATVATEFTAPLPEDLQRLLDMLALAS